MLTSDSIDLAISGKSVALRPQYPFHFETRKTFNATYFRNEQYQHEIANHYRDFKQRPRIRRRRRNIFVRYRKTAFAMPIGTDPYEYRDELPLPVHSFPRFALSYTPPRGRQCQCESQPPDETYNDSVRRIRAASSCEELKTLVQRYSGNIAKREKHYRQHKSRLGNYEKNETYKSDTDSKQQAAAKQEQQQQQKQQRRSLGNLQSVATACGKQRPTQQRSNDCCGSDKTTTASTELYLQLANEHYEREYLANVKYLESIPERNALILRARSNDCADSQTATLSASVENNWHYSRLASAKSNASSSSTNTDETTPRRARELSYGIANLLRLIGRKRSFRIGSNDSTAHEKICGKIKNWGIRVNITPAAVETAVSTAARKHSGEQRNTAFADSMHDYLNANTGKALQFLEATTYNTSSHKNNITANGLATSSAAWSTEHLHNIIDNLTQLDLNALNSRATAELQQSLIPRITLTNYCDLSKNQFYEGQSPYDFDNTDNQALKNPTSAYNSALRLKPTKFIYKANLDIPSESNYQSEARPP